MSGNEPILTAKKLSLRGIVFDFDGTLAILNIDFAHMRQAVLELLVAYRISLPSNGLKDLLVLEMIAAGADLLSQSRPEQGIEFRERAHALIADIEIKAARTGNLFAWTKDLLVALKRKNIRTGVITRNCLSAVRTLFPDIHAYADSVIARDQTSQVKPHPGHLLAMLQRIGVAAGQAVMVGDHPLDIKTGKDAAMCTIGVLTGSSRRPDLEQAGADLILDEAADILAMLD